MLTSGSASMSTAAPTLHRMATYGAAGALANSRTSTAAKGKIGRGAGLPTIGAVWRPPEMPRGSFTGNLHWLRVSNVDRYGREPFVPSDGEPDTDR